MFTLEKIHSRTGWLQLNKAETFLKDQIWATEKNKKCDSYLKIWNPDQLFQLEGILKDAIYTFQNTKLFFKFLNDSKIQFFE